MTDTATVKPELNDELLALAVNTFGLIRQNDTTTLRSRLEEGLQPDLRDENGYSLLMQACHDGRYQVCQMLLTQGADINATAPDGKTPLMFAAMFNHIDIIELLLTHGADPYAKSADDLTALGLARAMGAEAAARRLAQHVELF